MASPPHPGCQRENLPRRFGRRKSAPAKLPFVKFLVTRPSSSHAVNQIIGGEGKPEASGQDSDGKQSKPGGLGFPRFPRRVPCGMVHGGHGLRTLHAGIPRRQERERSVRGVFDCSTQEQVAGTTDRPDHAERANPSAIPNLVSGSRSCLSNTERRPSESLPPRARARTARGERSATPPLSARERSLSTATTSGCSM